MRRILGICLTIASLLGVSAMAAAQNLDRLRDQRVSLMAEQQRITEDRKWVGEGRVELAFQDIRITCDLLELDQVAMTLHAVGNVVLDQGPQRLTADELEYDLETKTGMLTEATGSFEPTFAFSAKRIEKISPTSYRLFDGVFTACDDLDSPPWRFRVRRAKLEEEGYGFFYGTSLDVKKVPVIYLPWLAWPLKQERATGLLIPSFGHSSQRGYYLGNALYLALGRSWDSTVLVDYYSEGFYGIGDELRWAPVKGAEGQLTVYGLYAEESDNWEYKIEGKHRSENFFGFRLLAEIAELSDIDFFQEFERDFESSTLRSLYSYLYLTRQLGPGDVNIRADRRKTFLSTGEITLTQLPELEYRVRSRRVARSQLYWSLISSANYFDTDRGEELKGSYGRLDLFPNLSWAMPTPVWLSLTPRVGARVTHYTQRLAEDRQTLEAETLDRTFFEAGLDIVGPSFSKVWDGKGKYARFKHLIEPRITYIFQSDADPEEAFIPRFDEVDSSRPTNRARITLANRLLGREKEGSARELASFELSQEYSLTDPLSHSTDGRESKRGPLGGLFRLTPAQGFTVDARASWDGLEKGLSSTSLSSSIRNSSQYLNLTWFTSYRPDTGETSSSQARLYAGIGKPESRLRLDFSINYDIERQEFLQQRVMLGFKGSCWGIRTEYRDLSLGGHETRDIRISIDFKGIGQLVEISSGLDSLGQ